MFDEKIKRAFYIMAVSVSMSFTATATWAAEQVDPELLRAKEFFETAGVPGDKWIEGETMVPHVAPAHHFKATMLYYPGTEELQSDEIQPL